MTLDAAEQAELDALLDRIKAYKYEREVLAPRRAAEEAQRRREAEATAHREREYARAAEAALRWTGWERLPLDLVRLQRHVVDVLLEEPAPRIYWLEPNTRSEELMRSAQGTAIKASRGVVSEPTIISEPILDVDSANTPLHEKGHLVTPQRGTKLQRECEAWHTLAASSVTRRVLGLMDHCCCTHFYAQCRA